MLRTLIRACALVALTAVPALAETVMFQSRLTGGFVGIDRSGLLAANASVRQALVLDMVRLEGRRVAFRDPDTGDFLRAGVGQQTYLAVASPHIRGWETFELMQDGQDVTLRSVQNGLYVGANGDRRLAATWGTRGRGQMFRLVPVGVQAPAAGTGAHRPTSDLPFAGSWVLDVLFQRGRALSLNDQALRQAQLRIARRGGLSGTTGCNTFDAALLEQGSMYEVQDFIMTRRRCHGARGEVARYFREALSDAAQFTLIGGDRMELRDHTGALRARFVRG